MISRPLYGKNPRLILAPANVITPVVHAAQPETVKLMNVPVSPPVAPSAVNNSVKRDRFRPINTAVTRVVNSIVDSTVEGYPSISEGINEVKTERLNEKR